MSSLSPVLRSQFIDNLSSRIVELKAELSHENLFLIAYVKLRSRLHAQSLNAPDPSPPGDTTRTRNLHMAARIVELRRRITQKESTLDSFEIMLAMHLEAKRLFDLALAAV